MYYSFWGWFLIVEKTKTVTQPPITRKGGTEAWTGSKWESTEKPRPSYETPVYTKKPTGSGAKEYVKAESAKYGEVYIPKEQVIVGEEDKKPKTYWSKEFTGGMPLKEYEKLKKEQEVGKITPFETIEEEPKETQIQQRTKEPLLFEAMKRPYGEFTRPDVAKRYEMTPGDVISISERLTKAKPVVVTSIKKTPTGEPVAVKELKLLSKEEAREVPTQFESKFVAPMMERITGRPYRSYAGFEYAMGTPFRAVLEPTKKIVSKGIESLKYQPTFAPTEPYVRRMAETGYGFLIEPFETKPVQTAITYYGVSKAFQLGGKLTKFVAPKILPPKVSGAITSPLAGKIAIGTTFATFGAIETGKEISEGEPVGMALAGGAGVAVAPMALYGGAKVLMKGFDVTFPRGYEKPIRLKDIKTVTTEEGTQFSMREYQYVESQIVRKPFWEWGKLEKRVPKRVPVIETTAEQEMIEAFGKPAIGTKVYKRAGYVETKLLLEQFSLAKEGKIGEISPPIVEEVVPPKFIEARISQPPLEFPKVSKPITEPFIETWTRKPYSYERYYPKTIKVYDVVSTRKPISLETFEKEGIIPKVQYKSTKEMGDDLGVFDPHAYTGKRFAPHLGEADITLFGKTRDIPWIRWTLPKFERVIYVRKKMPISGIKESTKTHERIHALSDFYKQIGYTGEFTEQVPAHIRRGMTRELRPMFQELFESGYKGTELLEEAYATIMETKGYEVLTTDKYPYTKRVAESAIRPTVILEEYIGKKTIKTRRKVEVPTTLMKQEKIRTIGVSQIKGIKIPKGIKIETQLIPTTIRKVQTIRKIYQQQFKEPPIQRRPKPMKEGEPMVGEEKIRYEKWLKKQQKEQDELLGGTALKLKPPETIMKLKEDIKPIVGYLKTPSKAMRLKYPFVAPPEYYQESPELGLKQILKGGLIKPSQILQPSFKVGFEKVPKQIIEKKQFFGIPSISKTKSILETKQLQIPISIPEQIPKTIKDIDIGRIQIDIAKVDQIPLPISITKSKLADEYDFRFPELKTPPFTPPPIPTLPSLLFFEPTRKKGKGKKRKYGYVPSLVAVGEEIFGKPKPIKTIIPTEKGFKKKYVYSGIEIRPLIKPKKMVDFL